MVRGLICKTAKYVQQKLQNEHTGHDWYHVQRVWRLAKELQKEEGGDLELIELTSLLHDLGDYKQYNFNEKKGSLALHGMMDILEIEEHLQNKIVNIVLESQYNGDETRQAKTKEGKIIQDADLLDAMGAVGVARVFANGGHINRMLHDPSKPHRKKLTKKAYQTKKIQGTSFNYFYEKTLKLPYLLNTSTAKKLAKERIKFVKFFMKKFLAEWDGKE